MTPREWVRAMVFFAQRYLMSSCCPVSWGTHSRLCGPVGAVTKSKLVSRSIGPEEQ